MSLFLNQRTVGSVTVLELGDQLKAQAVPEFRGTLEQLLNQGRTCLLLDCSRIQTADSVGIGSLVGMWISFRKSGGRLGLLNPSDRLQGVLKLVGLHDVIECFDDVNKVMPVGE